MWRDSTTLYFGRVEFQFWYAKLCDLDHPREKMAKLLADSGDPDQTAEFWALIVCHLPFK